MPPPPKVRTLRARLAAHESWARTADPAARTAPGRRKAMDRFRDEIDAQFPDVPEAQRAVMADHARKAYFSKLALKSAVARRAKAARKAPSTSDGGDGS